MYKKNDITDWLSQTTDNAKYFGWSPELWDKKSGLYINWQQYRPIQNHFQTCPDPNLCHKFFMSYHMYQSHEQRIKDNFHYRTHTGIFPSNFPKSFLKQGQDSKNCQENKQNLSENREVCCSHTVKEASLLAHLLPNVQKVNIFPVFSRSFQNQNCLLQFLCILCRRSHKSFSCFKFHWHFFSRGFGICSEPVITTNNICDAISTTISIRILAYY